VRLGRHRSRLRPLASERGKIELRLFAAGKTPARLPWQKNSGTTPGPCPFGLAGYVYGSNIHGVKGFPDALARCTGFEWDAGNADKNWEMHQVARGEIESIFFNRPLVVAFDLSHSQREPRYAALGATDRGRRLAVVFTVRGSLVRAISARDMSWRERRIYEQGISKT
jgi:uncharacterized DUF497 family protein